jgi:hypothetical protein
MLTILWLLARIVAFGVLAYRRASGIAWLGTVAR